VRLREVAAQAEGAGDLRLHLGARVSLHLLEQAAEARFAGRGIGVFPVRVDIHGEGR